MNILKLSKFFSNVIECKIDVEFTSDEVDSFNAWIKDNNYLSVIDFFASKRNMSIDVLCDIIYSKVDSLWQFIMDESYKKWEDELDRDEFLNKLTDYEKIAMMFGNFNYQVENNGLIHWDDNDYSKDLGFLYDFLDNCDYAQKDKFMQVLDDFSYVKTAIEELDCNNDWYNEDCETRLQTLNYYDEDYYKIKDSWKEYFEMHLIKNIPDEYLKKVINLNEDIKI